MSTPRVLLVEDATFHNVAPLAIEHIKVAFEAEGCQTDLVQESKAMDFQPSFFDLPARRNLKRLIELPSDIVIAAGPRAHILLKQASIKITIFIQMELDQILLKQAGIKIMIRCLDCIQPDPF